MEQCKSMVSLKMMGNTIKAAKTAKLKRKSVAYLATMLLLCLLARSEKMGAWICLEGRNQKRAVLCSLSK